MVDAPANLAKTGWDIAFVDLDADLARQLGSGSSAPSSLACGEDLRAGLGMPRDELRTAARAHFCQLINRPLHHDSLLGLLAGIKPSTASEKPPPREFGLNILVVEDNLVNQRLVQKLLSNLGVQAHGCGKRPDRPGGT